MQTINLTATKQITIANNSGAYRVSYGQKNEFGGLDLFGSKTKTFKTKAGAERYARTLAA